MSEEELRQLYSRQRYAIGADAQKKYSATSVVVVGLGGCACEVAKNLVLSGVRAVTLVDDRPVTWADLSTMFFATESDVGKPRAAVLAPRVAELNRLVAVTGVAASPTLAGPEVLDGHQVAVFVDAPIAKLAAMNDAARARDCKFVAVETRGVFGAVFVDGGQAFTILDARGEETATCVVVDMDGKGLVMCHDDRPHDAEVGDCVYFQGIAEPQAINTPFGAPAPRLFRITDVMSPTTFRVEMPEEFRGAAFRPAGGYVHVSRQPVQTSFEPLAAHLAAGAPQEVLFQDDVPEKMCCGGPLVELLWALADAAPGLWTAGALQPADVAAVCERVLQARPQLKDIVAAVGPALAGQWGPVACFFGGFVAQECLKLCSGKYTPLRQWYANDFREVLATVPADALRQPLGCRYDGQIAVFGSARQEALSKASVFIVGAGALGCELIKNWALAGIGRIIITDMDNIEMSNLSRQFLFRPHHIGQPKAVVAAAAARAINPHIRIDPLTEKVAQETENVFGPDFWEGVSVVCNALDNVAARRYVDSQCLHYKKALIESGTLGSKCNLQCVIPYLTVSYSSTYDPPEKTIPLCTLKNFPNSVEHTIQWARDAFEEQFVSIPRDVAAFLTNPSEFAASLEREPSTKATTIASIRRAVGQWPRSPSDCIVAARHLFDQYFSHTVQQLLYNIPLDRVDERGNFFWGGAKKPPTALAFDRTNPLHVSFIEAAANLLARVYKVHGGNDALQAMPTDEFGAAAGAVAGVPFAPTKQAYAMSETDGKDAQQEAAAVAAASLPDARTVSGTMVSEEFEKDNDANFHIDFITATSNLRATCYNIPVADRDKTKKIAGSIIPAMVTTTSYVTGAVVVEAMKYLGGEAKLANYRDMFTNLALPSVLWSEPQPVKGVTYANAATGRSVTWSMWDRIDIDEGADITVQALVTLIEERYEVELFMISLADGKMLYSSFSQKRDRLAKPVSQVLAELGGIKENTNYVTLVATGTYGEEDADIPTVRYKYRGF